MTSPSNIFDSGLLIGVLLYMVPGMLCGTAAAIASRDEKNPFAWTIFAGLMLVPPAEILGVGIGGFISGTNGDQSDLMHAAITGLLSCFFFGIYSPILCWIPALCVGLPVQAALQCARPGRCHQAAQQVPPQFSLRTLIGLMAVVPPLLAVWHYQLVACTAIAVAIFATQIFVHLAVRVLEPE